MTIEGPLAPWAVGMEERLAELGYAAETMKDHRRWVARLSGFLAERALGAGDVTDEVLGQFCVSLRHAGLRSTPTTKTFRWLVVFLRDVGQVPAVTPDSPRSELDALIERYRRFALDERGLSPETVTNYMRPVRVFLAEHAGQTLRELTAADVTRFMTGQTARLSVRGFERAATSLRSFFAFALAEGLIDTPLANAVPSAARWSVAGLPSSLTPAEVKALLAGCDLATSTGRRDYAILVLLVRLGLRAAEVAAMRLDDIDWRAGEIVVRGKARSEERMPLPADVGAAVAAYLRRDRPRRPEREVFLRVSAPLRGLAPEGVSEVVRAASERAELGSFGAHRLRHTAGTQMLHGGASLTEVAQVLRHRRVATTAIYAKVDHRALRTLAMPWPGSAR